MVTSKSWVLVIIIVLCCLVFHSLAWASQSALDFVDLTPPLVRIMSPRHDEQKTEEPFWIEVEVTDEESGVEQDAIVINLDGFDLTSVATFRRLDQGETGAARAWQIKVRPQDFLSEGEHLIQVDAVDVAGNPSTLRLPFDVLKSGNQPDWGISLHNSLSTVLHPLRRLHNTASLSMHFALFDQKFTLQTRSSLTDRPSVLQKPNLGPYYATLDSYLFSWQSKKFTLQCGQLSLPLDLGLLRLGSSFTGSYIVSRELPNRTLSAFHGKVVNSTGFGLSTSQTTGGIYQWQTKAVRQQLFVLRVETKPTTALGYKVHGVFPQGVYGAELVHGFGERKGSALRVQAGTSLMGISLEGDLTFLSSSYPLAALSPLTSSQGGSYQFTLGAGKEIYPGVSLQAVYSQGANNLRSIVTRTAMVQSLKLQLSGGWDETYAWQIQYQRGTRTGSAPSKDHSLRIALQHKGEKTSWEGNVLAGSSPSGRRYEWNVGQSWPLTNLGLTIKSSLQYSLEQGLNEEQRRLLRIRLSAHQAWFEDTLHTSLSATYLKRNATSDSLSLETFLVYQLNQSNALQCSATVSFWGNQTPPKQGVDYSLSLAWQAKVF